MISPMEAQGYYCLWHVCSCLYIFMHLGLCCLQQKVVLITVFHNKWDHLVNRTAGKISRFEKCENARNETDYMTVCVTFVNSVSLNECFLACHGPLDTFRSCTQEASTSFPLHHRCLPTACDTSFLEHWLLHIMRWKDHWRSRTLVRVAQKNR